MGDAQKSETPVNSTYADKLQKDTELERLYRDGAIFNADERETHPAPAPGTRSVLFCDLAHALG